MNLPVSPPVRPMLAALSRTLPEGDYRYEPKWDGFRALAFRSRHDVDLRSRNDRPFSRYFAELVAAFATLAEERLVVDGEILVVVAAVELHPYLAPVARPDHPGVVVFDVDPGAPAGMVDACRAAIEVRTLLADLALDSLVKTSGQGHPRLPAR